MRHAHGSGNRADNPIRPLCNSEEKSDDKDGVEDGLLCRPCGDEAKETADEDKDEKEIPEMIGSDSEDEDGPEARRPRARETPEHPHRRKLIVTISRICRSDPGVHPALQVRLKTSITKEMKKPTKLLIK